MERGLRRQLLADVAHRPWPLPARAPLMSMHWRDLCFLHWPVDPDRLRRCVPPQLELETFDGKAWLGVVPFEMRDTRPIGLPSFPGTANFPELNLRTYVRAGDKAGVWFFSLDAASRLAVRGARFGFKLPYFDARMRMERADGWIDYSSERTHRGAPPATFRGRYRPLDALPPAAPGSLEHFLTERYCLYSADRRGLLRGDIHHLPWPLHAAEVELEDCAMTALVDLELPDVPPVAHFAGALDVLAWWPVRG